LATVVGALSAIVTLADYLFARSFLSHWLQRQIKHDGEGWRISPTLNLMLIAGLVGLVWLATESSPVDPEARKRLFRLRGNIAVGCLVAWFFFGPSIGETDDASRSPPATVQNALPPSATIAGDSSLGEPSQASPTGGPPSHGYTSQFTWKRPNAPMPDRSWRPGDGLRAMARILEDATGTPPVPGR
jgi:hypothetical protein